MNFIGAIMDILEGVNLSDLPTRPTEIIWEVLTILNWLLVALITLVTRVWTCWRQFESLQT